MTDDQFEAPASLAVLERTAIADGAPEEHPIGPTIGGVPPPVSNGDVIVVVEGATRGNAHAGRSR